MSDRGVRSALGRRGWVHRRDLRRRASAVRAVLALLLAAAARPASGAFVELEVVPTTRGGLTVVIATLRDAGAGIDHAGLEIALPAGVRVRATSLGHPDCLALCNHDYVAPWRTVPIVVEHDDTLHKRCYFGVGVGFRPGGCDPRASCTGVALIDLDLGRGDPIPDGADLLQCTLETANTTAPGAYPVTCEASLSMGSDETSPAPCLGASVIAVCEGDCDHDGRVSIDEVVGGIAMALGLEDGASCAAIDRDRNAAVSIAELIRARVNLLYGCDYEPPTPAPTATPTPGPVRFGDPLHVRPGPYPAAVGMADLDRDGALDLMVALQPDYGIRDVKTFPVSLLFGRGDGTFADPLRVTVGNTPESVLAADFNNDGAPDLATGNFNAPFTVSVLLGHGDGSFAAQTQYPAGTRPAAIAATDFDRDGALDLVVANAVSRDLSLLYGRGDGSFADEVRLATCGAADLVAADFTSDGEPDVVAVARTGVCLHRNRGGALGAAEAISARGGFAAAAGRLDAGDRLDLAVLNDDENEIRVFANVGDGTFRALDSPSVSGEPRDLAIADLDGDGLADLVTANFESRDIAVLLGRGDGRFAPVHRVSVGPYSLPHKIAVGDLDGDGRLDVVTANANTHDVSVLLGVP